MLMACLDCHWILSQRKGTQHIHPTVFNLTQISSLPVQMHEVGQATRTNVVLGPLHRKGWLKLIPDQFTPFWRRKDALSVEQDCILWGCRVVIPEKLQAKVLSELHLGHPGMMRMKILARSNV